MLQEIPLLSLILYNIGVKFSSSQTGPANKTPSTNRAATALTGFSSLRKSWVEMVHFFSLELENWIFISRMSRFWRTNSRSPLGIRDFEEKFLFSNEWDFANIFSSQDSKFWERKVHFLLSIFPLNFSSNSREKSKFAILVDFDQQCFATRLPTRAFCGNILRGCTTEIQYNG